MSVNKVTKELENVFVYNIQVNEGAAYMIRYNTVSSLCLDDREKDGIK